MPHFFIRAPIACGFVVWSLSVVFPPVAGAGIVAVTGGVEEIAPPTSVKEGDLSSDSAIPVFLERSGHTLASSVRINAFDGGTYDENKDLVKWDMPSGFVTDLYYVHYDPVGLGGSSNGSVTFDGYIVGVIERDGDLHATNDALGRPGTDYPGALSDVGYELGGSDRFIISDDRRTLTVYVHGNFGVDDLRVLVVPTGVSCKLDLVFVMDTSGSMADEADLIRTAPNSAAKWLQGLGFDVAVSRLGITKSNSIALAEVIGHPDGIISSLYGPTVPGGACQGGTSILGACPTSGLTEESWADGTAIVAERYPWRAGSIRVALPASDDFPCCGSDKNNDEAIANCIDVCNANGVTVVPIKGSATLNASQDAKLKLHMDTLADGTNGLVDPSMASQADLRQALIVVAVRACNTGCAPPKAAFTIPETVCGTTNVVLNGTASYEEDNYYLEICPVGESCDLTGWSSWFNGAEVGIVNLSNYYPFTVGKTYRIKLAVQNDCLSWHEAVHTVTIVPDISLTVTPNPADLCSGQVTLVPHVTGGGGPFTFFWSRTSWYPPQSIPLGAAPTLVANDPGLYDCFVTDSNGCVAYVQVPVTGASSCVSPPARMVGWWPLDEAAGPTASEISRYSNTDHPGTHVDDPLVVAGKVGNALSFSGTDYVLVPHSDLYNIGSNTGVPVFYPDPDHGDFSIDAWIRPDQLHPELSAIVAKGSRCLEWIDPTGYSFGVNLQGLLEFSFTTQYGGATYTSSPAWSVPVGVWSHVAVTLDRDQPTGVRFFLNGNLVGTGDPTGVQGGVSTTFPLYIGVLCDLDGVEGEPAFEGAIDEVEIFRRPLLDTEVEEIAHAGDCSLGKCREFVVGGSQVMLCPGENSRSVTVQVCNLSGSTRTYDLAAAGLPAGTYSDIGYCDVEGPGIVNVSPNQVTLAPGACTAVTVEVFRPSGLTGSGQRAGYEITVTPQGGSHAFVRRGVVVEAVNFWCPISSVCVSCPPDTTGGGIPPLSCQVDYGFSVSVANLDITARSVNYEVRAVDAHGAPTSIVALNGGPPGAGVTGQMIAPGGGQGNIAFNARFESNEPYNVHELQVFLQTDEQGTMTLLDAVSVRSTGKDEPVVCTPDWSVYGGSGPSARHDHATAYDLGRSEVVLFGGFDGTNRLNDTWVWDGASWTQRNPSQSPSPRTSPGMTYDSARGKVILHGGRLDGNLFSNETWEWDGVNWSLTSTTAPVRDNMGLAYDPIRQVTVLYGGGGPTGRGRDTWEYDGTDWTQVSADSPPGYRSGHRMVYVDHLGLIFIFGGATPGNVDTQDNWTYDGTTWTNLGPGGPPARTVHAMAYDPLRRAVYVYGGAGNGVNYEDLWVWTDGSWSQESATNPPGAVRNSDLEFVPDPGHLVLFGGFDGAQTLGDTWIYGCSGPASIVRPGSRNRGADIVLSAHPNPFQVSTSIVFDAPSPGLVRAGIFDVAGRLVRGFEPIRTPGSGRQELFWDGTGSSGRPVPPGVYYLRLDGPEIHKGIKLVRIR